MIHLTECLLPHLFSSRPFFSAAVNASNGIGSGSGRVGEGPLPSISIGDAWVLPSFVGAVWQATVAFISFLFVGNMNRSPSKELLFEVSEHFMKSFGIYFVLVEEIPSPFSNPRREG